MLTSNGSAEKLYIYNEEEILLVRNLVEKMGCLGDGHLIVLFRAVVAGMSQKENDFHRFLEIVSASPTSSLKAESMMVLIRLLLESGNFNEARQLAADLHQMEHYVLHALARVRIAKFSEDEEDEALATEFMRELLESYISKT